MALVRACSRAVPRVATCGRVAVAASHALFSNTTSAWDLPGGVVASSGVRAGSWRRGLVNEHATEEFYTRRLDLADAAQLLEEEGYLWGAAVADATMKGVDTQQYVAGVIDAADEFMRKRDLHDRDAVRRQLGVVLKSTGSFALVLGAKSVGKSFLLKKIALELQSSPEPRRTVTYDARLYGSDLTNGIIRAIDAQLPESFMDLMRKGMQRAVKVSAVGISAAPVNPSAAQDVGVPTREPTLEDVLTQFVGACEQEGTYPCLIVDEANEALAVSVPKDRRRADEALRALTQFTKQEQRMNVVLAASEHSEPFRLHALGFKSTHWTTIILVGEVPPAAMRDLLMTKWGMGPNLADACMSVWGGHVWGVYHGLKRLSLETSTFVAISNPVVFSEDVMDGASACVQAEDSDPDIKDAPARVHRHMRTLLRDVAERGYAPVTDKHDPRLRLGSELNVLAAFMRSAYAAHIPREALTGKTRVAAVPASQAVRVLLAQELRGPKRPHAGAAAVKLE